MKFRHDTLKREILKKIPDLEPLDSKRYFTEEQRHAIYQKFNGKCCECGEVCDKLNFQIDHKIPYIKGGKTTLSNAQLTHPECNQKKGAT